MPKGWKWSGSPDCSIDRTFISTFYFLRKITKANHFIRIYQNLIFLAREYRNMIDSSEVKSLAELAKLKGLSRVR
jgi:hypothetical protein